MTLPESTMFKLAITQPVSVPELAAELRRYAERLESLQRLADATEQALNSITEGSK